MTTYTPGDILLVNDYAGSSDLLGNLIRAGERARYGNSDHARWTHAALITTTDGDIVEALAHGVCRSHVTDYNAYETLVISPRYAAASKRDYAVRFATAQVGDRYDVIDFATIALSILTGFDLSLHTDKRYICSGLVSRATESYTFDGYQYPTEQMMPADIGDYWRAFSNEPLPALSLIGRLLDKIKAISWALSPFKTGIRPVTPT